jgi:hypothetical protein
MSTRPLKLQLDLINGKSIYEFLDEEGQSTVVAITTSNHIDGELKATAVVQEPNIFGGLETLEHIELTRSMGPFVEIVMRENPDDCKILIGDQDISHLVTGISTGAARDDLWMEANLTVLVSRLDFEGPVEVTEYVDPLLEEFYE